MTQFHQDGVLLPFNANPHTPGTDAHEAWQQAWADARELDYELRVLAIAARKGRKGRKPRVTVDLGFGAFRVLVHRIFEDGNMLCHYIKDGKIRRFCAIHSNRIIGGANG